MQQGPKGIPAAVGTCSDAATVPAERDLMAGPNVFYSQARGHYNVFF